MIWVAGAPISQTDGGYVVNGWLQYAHPEHARRNSQGQVDVPWVSAKSDRPYKIANRVAAGFTELKRFPSRALAGLVRNHLRVEGAPCSRRRQRGESARMRKRRVRRRRSKTEAERFQLQVAASAEIAASAATTDAVTSRQRVREITPGERISARKAGL